MNGLDELLQGLNDEQRAAVTATEGFVRVIAGAGSGKTRALAHRFAYLVNVIGVLPSSILCVTFTNKSANEMRNRIRALSGDAGAGYISTFHGFCVAVLQEDISAVAYPKNFLVLDNADIDAMLNIIYDERGLTLRNMTFSEARDRIEMRKNQIEPQYYVDMIALSIDELKLKYDTAVEPEDVIFYGYLYQQKKCFGLDYNDLINFTLYIFDHHEIIREKWQNRLEYIMIDEFQDIDQPQYRLMKALIGKHSNLFVVGDPDQTIYTWRGANVAFLLAFDRDFPNVRTIVMSKNYRSVPPILSAVNDLIRRNKQRVEKDLLPVRQGGKLPVYFHAKTAKDEAFWIAEQIRTLNDAGVPLSDCAVLYRAHYVTRTLEEVFQKEKLPYVIHSGVAFFERAEIKDALSYLRMAAFKDDLSFLRIVNKPRRNIGERRIKFLTDYAASHGCSLYDALKACSEDDLFKTTGARRFIALIEHFSSLPPETTVSELMSDLLDESGYEHDLRTAGSQERLDNLAELKQAIYEFETTCGEESTLTSFLSHVALFTNADALGGKNAVRLMTVHAAKGLEFPYVFLCSLSEGVFPSKKIATIEGMEEERRLAFVAMTRAKDGLYLSDAEGLNHDGSFRYPSRFVLDIDKRLIDYAVELPESVVSAAERRSTLSEKTMRELSSPNFSVGDRILHPVMGAGTVVGIDSSLLAYIIRFDDIPTERKISFRIQLERI
ncbi:MAG: ATP-dependent helicase [Christensenellales bacterium]|jgi:DNA helicase-2/ATP-dependent DNA helicase PcrA